MTRLGLALTVLPFLVLGCARGPGVDGVRMPLFVMDGEGVVQARRFQSWPDLGGPERFDLWIGDAQGAPERRLVRRVDVMSLWPRSVSPDGRNMVCLAGSSSRPDLVFVDLDTGENRILIEETEMLPGSLCWDPLGRWVAVTFAKDSQIGVIDTWTWEFRRHPTLLVVHDWIPGPRPRLLMATDRPSVMGNALSAWELEGTSPPIEIFATENGGVIRSASVSPTGQHAAVIVAEVPDVNSLLVLLDLTTGERSVVWESPRPLVGLHWSQSGEALFVSQLGRFVGSGWILNRLTLAERRPRPVAEHRGGWAVSPDGERLAITTGEEVVVRPIGEDDVGP